LIRLSLFERIENTFIKLSVGATCDDLQFSELANFNENCVVNFESKFVNRLLSEVGHCSEKNQGLLRIPRATSMNELKS
jgi:hypothetical protein